MPLELDQKVEIWKNKLLDLGKRNRLINYRETKRSTLTIKNPGIFDLWDSIVEKNDSLIFPMYFENQEDEIESETDEEDIIDEEEMVLTSGVQTNQTVKELQKTLRNLRNKAKMAIEEQGINILYLGFGFLKWTEADYSRNQIVSPLILVPVSLTVESIADPFVLQMTDDEIVVNPALKYKLESDFGISLPEYDDESGLQSFLDASNKAIKNNNWTISEDVGLSLFSFLKINMYSDLNRNKDDIVSNEIVRAIAGDHTAVQHIPEDLNDFDFDKMQRPIDVFQVVDADSSQQEAILCAKKGISFVLQGPPGTGKSQTITNIIAECLADGKKILFVSEKMAALDVVHKRLTAAGLDDFCLVLHSHKANKKAVLEQLRASLNLAKNKAQLSDDAIMKLEALYQDKEKLNDYAEQIFANVAPLNMTIYQVNGILASIDDYPEVIFSISDVRNTSFEKYNRYLYVLTDFKNTIGKMSEDFDSNPWRGSVVQFVSNELRHDVNARFPKLEGKLRQVASTTDEMFVDVSLNYDCTYARLQDAKKLFAVAKNSPLIPYSWITEDDIQPFMEEVELFEAESRVYEDKVKDLQNMYFQVNNQGICSLKKRCMCDLNSVDSIEGEQKILEKCIKSVEILSRIAHEEQFVLLQRERSVAEDQAKQIRSIKARLENLFTADIFTFDYKQVLSGYLESYFELLHDVQRNNRISFSASSQPFVILPKNWLLEDLDTLYDCAQECYGKQTAFNKAKDTLKKIAEILLTNGEYTISDVDQLVSYKAIISELECLQRHISEHSEMSRIDTGNLIDSCKREIAIAAKKAEEIQALKTNVLKNYDRSVFDIDFEGMLARFKTEYTSFFKIFKGSYRADQKQMKLLYKSTSSKLEDDEIVAVLSTIKEIAQIRTDIDNECKNIVSVFGEKFRYEDTDFSAMQHVLNMYVEMKNAVAAVSEMHTIIEQLLPDDENMIGKYGLLYRGLDTSWGDVIKVIEWSAKSREKLLKDGVLLRKYYKNVAVDITAENVFLALQTLEEVDHEKGKCNSLLSRFMAVMDGVFAYEDTDFKQVDAYLTTYSAIIKSKDILNVLESMIRILVSKETVLKSHYDFLYDGMATSWNEVRSALTWAVHFKEVIALYSPNGKFIERICSDKNVIENCGKYETQIDQMLQDISYEFKWFISLFDESETYETVNLHTLSERIKRCCNGLFLLEEWIDFVNARKNCTEEGLGEYIQKFEEQKFKPYQILPIFQKRFFRLWLDAVLPEYPAILNFRRLNQENTIREFSELDKLQFEIAKARVKSKLINNLPLLDKFTSGMDEMGILKRELSKQRKIMPIRKLFRQIPNLLMVLKPCLMMSPLSVSLFLEADTYQFDIVIFDEASQVCTENAIGAIARGKQVIIAGDSKQLPPTSFFTTSTSDTDDFDTDDEDDDTTAYESILDEANLLPERTLLWHYRSRHEHLIAFSNAKIYHHNLITFPSNVDKVPDNGVEYVYVREGFYDRGGKKGNVPEAKRVAAMVFEHFNKFPNRSLGVIAFGEVQQQAIELAIRDLRMKNQQYETFFNEEKEEAFFVKNLENVQGDERDTIIFSVGYAKDNQGILRMNFGPLSKSGGERRLNVAITRAKYNIKLVGSILPTDIDIDRISAEGPKLLRAYIDFAINGISSLEREITESDITQHDSPFEKAVYDFLDRRGYKLATQVGCSGYRIDMAVKHPTISGQYVLGIECDGATYHSAKTARERDRLRQDVLENMGWKIYRIWSTDWIKDSITEGERLIEVIEQAIADYGVEEPSIIQQESTAEEFVSFEEKVISIEDMENPYGLAEEKEVSFNQLSQRNGYLSGTDCVMEIVNTLYPVHYDLICQQMAPLYGNVKATVKVKREVDYCLRQLGRKVINKGDFYYPEGYTKIVPRKNTRKINHVSIDELAEAMYIVLTKSVGLTKEQLCVECARAYNYQRMTPNITAAVNSAFDMLLVQNRVEIIEGKVNVPK
ncbi:hypothetical protein BHF70_04840 [Anaerostipes sp. 494a]|uniref:DUF4011 domain-containing protein n=1 Tax=Anaerostipes sp. 494a TaxID=1261636 RepID=UPI0009517953|nr:DUF4011 domain-containing protein [Anaerostipes sp. 494a]OLR59008.1 hypothetical protein BHF70_04840 [Anaerostipes sp. 494a]